MAYALLVVDKTLVMSLELLLSVHFTTLVSIVCKFLGRMNNIVETSSGRTKSIG